MDTEECDTVLSRVVTEKIEVTVYVRLMAEVKNAKQMDVESYRGKKDCAMNIAISHSGWTSKVEKLKTAFFLDGF